MVSDYLIPWYQSYAHEHVFKATTLGAMMGYATSRLLLSNGPRGIRGIVGAVIGGSVAGMGSLYRSYYEATEGKMWIPERRRLEHEVNTYYDILKYVKYAGLYEKSREELMKQGIDVEALADQINVEQVENKKKREFLEKQKRNLYKEMPGDFDELRKEINEQLKLISESRQSYILPEGVQQALKYREEAETTLYAIDPFDDYQKVLRALPYKDKFFFDEFVGAKEEDRNKILGMVPENEGRILKALWGKELEPQQPLDRYFQDYYLPDQDWEGWRPDVNLDAYKVNTVNELGLDMSDFNFWSEDLLAAKQYKKLQYNTNQVQAQWRGYQFGIQSQLESILKGQGMTNVRVTVRPTFGVTKVNMDYTPNQENEVEQMLLKSGLN